MGNSIFSPQAHFRSRHRHRSQDAPKDVPVRVNTRSRLPLLNTKPYQSLATRLQGASLEGAPHAACQLDCTCINHQNQGAWGYGLQAVCSVLALDHVPVELGGQD